MRILRLHAIKITFEHNAAVVQDNRRVGVRRGEKIIPAEFPTLRLQSDIVERLGRRAQRDRTSRARRCVTRREQLAHVPDRPLHLRIHVPVGWIDARGVSGRKPMHVGARCELSARRLRLRATDGAGSRDRA